MCSWDTASTQHTTDGVATFLLVHATNTAHGWYEHHPLPMVGWYDAWVYDVLPTTTHYALLHATEEQRMLPPVMDGCAC
jgi:hypothetical protein